MATSGSASIETASSSFNLTEGDKIEFQEYLKKMDKKLSVLCCGPTGVGKSTLLNGLMGNGKLFDVGDLLIRGTHKVTEGKFTKNDIEVTVWDTPGLEGEYKHDKIYLDDIKKCSKHDIFLYCISLTDARATELFDDKSSLVRFTELFGVELWKRAVVILTLANALEAKCEEDKEIDPAFDVENGFKDRIRKWELRIQSELMKRGVSKKQAQKVPVLPAGCANSVDLPGYPYWLSIIFEKVSDRMKYDAKLAYLLLSKDKLVIADQVNKEDIENKNIEDQPFVLNSGDKVLAGGVGVTGTLVGAGIGATIGALAIGIPTFGVAAGAGLVIGGAVGAFFGGISSLATGMAIKYFKKRKAKKAKKAKK